MLTRVTGCVLPIPLVLSLAGAPWAPGPPRAATWLERQVWVMGTLLTLRTPASPENALPATEAAFAAVRGIDDLLSTWRDDAELARANRAPVGDPVTLSPALRSLLVEAERLADATGRAFDPTVGALVDAWDLRRAGRLPDSLALQQARAASGPAAVTLTDDGLMRRAAGAWIDAGGFGKGAGLRAAARVLALHGIESALLNFGGQVLVIGGPPQGEAWPVPVAHPAHRERPVLTLGLRDASAATTGQSERTVTVRGTRLGHVLDPRTGRPVAPWGSVTVVHPDPLAADALSTALFVLGPTEGLRWAETHRVAALFLIDTPAGLVVRESTALAGQTARAAISRS